jgi:hypothetical protein
VYVSVTPVKIVTIFITLKHHYNLIWLSVEPSIPRQPLTCIDKGGVYAKCLEALGTDVHTTGHSQLDRAVELARNLGAAHGKQIRRDGL